MKVQVKIQHCCLGRSISNANKKVQMKSLILLTLISAPAMKHPGFPDISTADLAEPSAMNCRSRRHYDQNQAQRQQVKAPQFQMDVELTL